MIWLPNDETQLRDALDQGLLRERHTLDFKSALPLGRGANKELAKDLAQFAIDGGVLIIGVDDNDKTIPPKLTPVDLNDLKERVDNVARSIPDPPMRVRTEPIYIAGTTRGYLFVIVPSTPYEPRQVDGVYHGRGDTTRYRLPAAEVERCYQVGLRIQRDITTLLDEAVQDDPWQARRHAHLFGVAQPVRPGRICCCAPSVPQALLHLAIRTLGALTWRLERLTRHSRSVPLCRSRRPWSGTSLHSGTHRRRFRADTTVPGYSAASTPRSSRRTSVSR